MARPSSLPFGQSLLLRRLQEQLGRSQVILLHQRQPSLDQSRGIPAGPLEDAGIHRPQVRRHRQTAGQHQQAGDGAQQEPCQTAHHDFVRAYRKSREGQPVTCRQARRADFPVRSNPRTEPAFGNPYN